MDRRSFLKTAASSAGAPLLSSKLAKASSAKPNVLLFLLDQMRRPVWFPDFALLENYERLKSHGLEFSNHFVSAVPCSPSRACLMTGLHMDQNRVYNNMFVEVQPSLDPRIPTLGRLFQEAGYQTPYFGKWHLIQGSKAKKDPGLKPYGFEWIMRETLGPFMPGLRKDPDFTRGATNWLSNSSNYSRPWFLTLSLTNPHDICAYPRGAVPASLVPDSIERLPDNWGDDLETKPGCQKEYQKAYGVMSGDFDIYDEKKWLHYLDYYYFLNRRIDRLLGRVMDALEASGQIENTLIIFTSDHGDMGGSHRLRSKGPCVYRENANVPLVFHWPGVIPKGSSCDALTQNVDMFPTLVGLLGHDAASRYPHLPGSDLSETLTDPAKVPGRDHALFSFTNNIHLANSNRLAGKPGVTSPQNIRAIRQKDFVYARYFDPGRDQEEYELYDLVNDPLEMKNLAGDPGYKALKREMAEKLARAEAHEMAPVNFESLLK